MRIQPLETSLGPSFRLSPNQSTEKPPPQEEVDPLGDVFIGAGLGGLIGFSSVWLLTGPASTNPAHLQMAITVALLGSVAGGATAYVLATV